MTEVVAVRRRIRKPLDLPRLLAQFDCLPDSAIVRGVLVRELLGGITYNTYWHKIKRGEIPPAPHTAGSIRAALARAASEDR